LGVALSVGIEPARPVHLDGFRQHLSEPTLVRYLVRY